jgi:hypothetical protein
VHSNVMKFLLHQEPPGTRRAGAYAQKHSTNCWRWRHRIALGSISRLLLITRDSGLATPRTQGKERNGNVLTFFATDMQAGKESKDGKREEGN